MGVHPFERRIEIENIAARTDYKDWYRIGQELNGLNLLDLLWQILLWQESKKSKFKKTGLQI